MSGFRDTRDYSVETSNIKKFVLSLKPIYISPLNFKIKSLVYFRCPKNTHFVTGDCSFSRNDDKSRRTQ